MSRTELDLTHLDEIPRKLDLVNPAAVVNCAAYTDVDGAEDEEELATLVNGEAVGVLAEWANSRNRGFLTFSSDYVFNGEAKTPYVEASPTAPINAYGRSKLQGERLALSRGALVIRTSWVISGSHPSFVSKIIEKARDRPLQVVDDQLGTPTIAEDLARVSFSALAQGVTGLLHVTNQGPVSWYDLAREAVTEAGIDPGRILPCSTAEYTTRAPRPQFSVLASERLSGLNIPSPGHWSASLPRVVSEIRTWL